MERDIDTLMIDCINLYNKPVMVQVSISSERINSDIFWPNIQPTPEGPDGPELWTVALGDVKVTSYDFKSALVILEWRLKNDK